MRPQMLVNEHSPITQPPPRIDGARHALFLDIDGTLAPLIDDPAAVRISAPMRSLLKAAEDALGGALAIITGRTLEDADSILGAPFAHVAGVHGGEMRIAGESADEANECSNVAAALRDIEARFGAGGPRAPRLENKRISIALHYRHAPEAEAETRKIAAALAARHGLHMQTGKMVVELLANSRTKADALRDFLAAAPFAGRTPIAVGDDVTDEHAFAAAAAHGGVGVLVGPPRPSAARAVLSDPPALAAWLAADLGLAP